MGFVLSIKHLMPLLFLCLWCYHLPISSFSPIPHPPILLQCHLQAYQNTLQTLKPTSFHRWDLDRIDTHKMCVSIGGNACWASGDRQAGLVVLIQLCTDTPSASGPKAIFFITPSASGFLTDHNYLPFICFVSMVCFFFIPQGGGGRMITKHLNENFSIQRSKKNKSERDVRCSLKWPTFQHFHIKILFLRWITIFLGFFW